jgi:hypothetical protein
LARKFLVPTLVLSACLALVSTAAASTQVLNDPKGDSKTDVDLKKASVGYDGTTLEFTIRSYAKLPHGARPCIEIGSQFLIGCFGNVATDDQTGDTLFKVKFSKTAKSVTYTFRADQLSTPAPPSIRWHAFFLEQDRPADSIPKKGFSKFVLTP